LEQKRYSFRRKNRSNINNFRHPRYSLQPAAFSTNNASKIDLNDPELDERERVIAALEQADWVQAKAARLLGMTPNRLPHSGVES
jgi:transcriptional regulator with GAF, ATPase, and Fis domain